MRGIIVSDVSRACDESMHEWCLSTHCECACHYRPGERDDDE